MTSMLEGLTFDDVLLLPAHSTVLPKAVQLSSPLVRDIVLNIPLLSAAMDTVTEARLAIALAQEGGMGIIHKNMPVDAQVQQVRQVKKHESGIVMDPITVTPDTTVRELRKITETYHISGMPVVEGKQLVGIVTGRDVRFETNLDLPVAKIMTPREHLVTVREGAPAEEVLHLLQKHRLEKILVINSQFELRGLITVKDISKAQSKPLAAKDAHGHLRVGAAVGVGADYQQRVSALIQVGVDAIVVDTAHGHAQAVLNAVQWIHDHFPATPLIAGNVATRAAAEALIACGADALKVGIGPGSICTTRIISGVGVPQITAIQEVSAVAKPQHIPVIADGGIRYSGDICKALAAGADMVMIGSLFAGTEESPGEIELYQGRTYKAYRGMGSVGAMAKPHGSADRYFQDFQNNPDKLVPEAVEGRVPYKGTLANIVYQLMGGVRAGMGYLGAENISALQTKATWVKITAAGMRESHAHDVGIIKEPPNYPVG